MYRSTRSNKLISASEAIIHGIASDKGLFLPEKIPNLDLSEKWINYSYQDIAKIVFTLYFDDFSEKEIDYVVSNAYSQLNFKKKIYDLKLFNDYAFLELFHGNTFAFKDMALSALPYFMEVAKNKVGIKKKLKIVVATSGDTGGAVLNAFKNNDNIDVVVIYPHNGVSKTQEQQMLSLQTSHSKAFALKGNFDDCQRLAKEILNDNVNNPNILISSANSINIARLVPQIVYYIASYFDLVRRNFIKYGEEINVSVPTGNFGNILAAYLAKKMGLKINKLICASNQNDVLTQFFNEGIYNRNRSFYLTSSPSMDILVSSNLERLIALELGEKRCKDCMSQLDEKGEYILNNNEKKLFADFIAYKASDSEVSHAIHDIFYKDNYLIDPHTAVAYLAYKNSNIDGKTLIVSTAAPYKFVDTINKATGKTFEAFSFLNPHHTILLSKKEIIDYILNEREIIEAHASSANIGIGFDCLGIGLNFKDVISYMPFNKYVLYNFDYKHSFADHNLIVKSYETVSKAFNVSPKPLFIESIDMEIPSARGMGSSATLILLGALIAKQMFNLDDEKLFEKTIIDLEGHPDNVIPAYKGGLVASFKDGDCYQCYSLPISDKLHFYVGYPDYKVPTKLARKALPKKYSRADVVANLSRMALLAKAFENGDVKLLKQLLVDCIHEPYRKQFIKEYPKINEYFKDKDVTVTISGSGPTLLFIANREIDFAPLALNNWTFKKTTIYRGSK